MLKTPLADAAVQGAAGASRGGSKKIKLKAVEMNVIQYNQSKELASFSSLK